MRNIRVCVEYSVCMYRGFAHLSEEVSIGDIVAVGAVCVGLAVILRAVLGIAVGDDDALIRCDETPKCEDVWNCRYLGVECV